MDGRPYTDEREERMRFAWDNAPADEWAAAEMRVAINNLLATLDQERRLREEAEKRLEAEWRDNNAGSDLYTEALDALGRERRLREQAEADAERLRGALEKAHEFSNTDGMAPDIIDWKNIVAHLRHQLSKALGEVG